MHKVQQWCLPHTESRVPLWFRYAGMPPVCEKYCRLKSLYAAAENDFLSAWKTIPSSAPQEEKPRWDAANRLLT
jgi:hypothetical protein